MTLPSKQPIQRLSRAQHAERARQARDLRDVNIGWQIIVDHLGYSSIAAAKTAVKRHAQANPKPGKPKATQTGTKQKAKGLQAGGLRQIGATWTEIAEQLGYRDDDAARLAWERYRRDLPPTEYAATKMSRWEYLYRNVMTLLGNAIAAQDLPSAQNHITAAAALLATQPPADYTDHDDIAGQALAEHFSTDYAKA